MPSLFFVPSILLHRAHPCTTEIHLPFLNFPCAQVQCEAAAAKTESDARLREAAAAKQRASAAASASAAECQSLRDAAKKTEREVRARAPFQIGNHA
eukprot:COSAG05_NODE_1880_length_3909_cov_1.531234_5_plen_97_part_00